MNGRSPNQYFMHLRSKPQPTEEQFKYISKCVHDCKMCDLVGVLKQQPFNQTSHALKDLSVYHSRAVQSMSNDCV